MEAGVLTAKLTCVDLQPSHLLHKEPSRRWRPSLSPREAWEWAGEEFPGSDTVGAGLRPTCGPSPHPEDLEEVVELKRGSWGWAQVQRCPDKKKS